MFILKFIFELILFVVMYVLIPFCGTATFLVLLFQNRAKGYFKTSATNYDRFANKEYASLWNQILIKPGGYQFGIDKETMSGVLGKNERDYTKIKIVTWWFGYRHRVFKETEYRLAGIFLNRILWLIERKHCTISIDDKISWKLEKIYDNLIKEYNEQIRKNGTQEKQRP